MGWKMFGLDNDSIANYIRESNTEYIGVSNLEFLRNVNNPDEPTLIKNQLNNV